MSECAAITSISAIAFCRALNIPARYATGYLGDIGVPLTPPMDFSAWFEVYLDNQWWIFDARNNIPRIGRVLIATGRDASDVAITTSFGAANLTRFTVIAEEVNNGDRRASRGLTTLSSGEFHFGIGSATLVTTRCLRVPSC